MRLSLLFAVLNLKQNPRRTMLLMLGLAGAGFLVVLFESVVAGVTGRLVDVSSALTTGDVNVGGVYKAEVYRPVPILKNGSAVRALLAADESVTASRERLRSGALLVGAKGFFSGAIEGVNLADEPRLRSVLQVLPGKGDLDALSRPGAAVLFEADARALGVDVGDVVTVRSRDVGAMPTVADFDVVAIVRDMGLVGSQIMFAELSAVKALYHLAPEATGSVQLEVATGVSSRAHEERVRNALATNTKLEVIPSASRSHFGYLRPAREAKWLGERAAVTTRRDEMVGIAWVQDILAIVGTVTQLLIAALLLLGLMNSMWVAVRARTREIGTMRAVGMGRSGVVGMFLFEAALLGLGGGLVGAFVAAGAVSVLQAVPVDMPVAALRHVFMSDTLLVRLDPSSLLSVPLLLSGVALLASIAPARAAARIPPAVAMREHH